MSTAGLPGRPVRPPLARPALALGVALGLHAAAVLAWSEGVAGRLATALAGPPPGRAAEGPVPTASVVRWLALPAAEPPAAPRPAAAPQPRDAAPAAPAGPAGPAGAPGLITKHGEPWTLGLPDLELGAPRQVLMLRLQLDAARRVEAVTATAAASAEASGAPSGAASGAAPADLAAYVGDQLLGAELHGAAVAGGTACLEVVFDATEARAAWRLHPPLGGALRCPRPARA